MNQKKCLKLKETFLYMKFKALLNMPIVPINFAHRKFN